MSFEMLVRLIKEGKVDYVEIMFVLDELNVRYLWMVGGVMLILFV